MLCRQQVRRQQLNDAVCERVLRSLYQLHHFRHAHALRRVSVDDRKKELKAWRALTGCELTIACIFAGMCAVETFAATELVLAVALPSSCLLLLRVPYICPVLRIGWCGREEKVVQEAAAGESDQSVDRHAASRAAHLHTPRQRLRSNCLDFANLHEFDYDAASA